MGIKDDLIKLLQDNPATETFQPYCFISKEADTLTAYFADVADYSKRLNDHVTLYLSLESNDIVGCRIKSIRGILDDLPNYIEIKHGKVQLSIIFLAFRGCDKEKETINRLASEANKSKCELVVT